MLTLVPSPHVVPTPLTAGSAPVDQLGRALNELRVSVTDRCNLRCRYCMPRERFAGHRFLSRSHLLTYEELARVAGILQRLGVRRVRLTGGEPLVRRDLEVLVRQLAALGLAPSMTTNGLLLSERVVALRDAGLAAVTVSLDAHDDDRFRAIVDADHSVSDVLAGIDAAREAGVPTIKVNCVVQRGVNDDQIVGLAEMFRGTGVVLRFIEYMDVGETNGWRRREVFSADDIVGQIDARFPLEPAERDRPSAPALRYRYRDGAGEIGVVASVTRPFCGGCTRARLSAEGRLYTCLFAQDGVDLRHPLRSGATDGDVARLVRTAWSRRDDRYSELRGAPRLLSLGRRRREMSYLGG